MDVNLLEAKSNSVTLHFNSIPHRFEASQSGNDLLSIKIRRNGIAEMLIPGMSCVAEFPGGERKDMIIENLRDSGKWVIADCRRRYPATGNPL
jgi:hypothetical protein